MYDQITIQFKEAIDRLRDVYKTGELIVAIHPWDLTKTPIDFEYRDCVVKCVEDIEVGKYEIRIVE